MIRHSLLSAGQYLHSLLSTGHFKRYTSIWRYFLYQSCPCYY